MDSVWKHLKAKLNGSKYTVDDIKAIRKQAKIPKRLINSVVQRVNKDPWPYKKLSDRDEKSIL